MLTKTSWHTAQKQKHCQTRVFLLVNHNSYVGKLFSSKQLRSSEKLKTSRCRGYILTALTTEVVVSENSEVPDLYKLAQHRLTHRHIRLKTLGSLWGEAQLGFSLSVWNMSTHLALLETFHLTAGWDCWLLNTLGLELGGGVGSVCWQKHVMLPLVRGIVLGDTLLKQVTMC